MSNVRRAAAAAARMIREQRGWSREKLAAEAGISFQTVYRLERGTLPRAEHLIQIANALEVSLDELVGRESPNPASPGRS